MNKRRTLQALGLIGVASSGATAYVARSIGTGGGNDFPSGCLFLYFVLVLIAFLLWFTCITYCSDDGVEGLICNNTCTLWFIILELAALVSALLCLIFTGPY